MPPTIAVPPELAALAPPAGPLRPVSVRLDLPTMTALDALAQRLGGAHRGVLLRHLIGRGLAAVLAELGGLELG